VGKSSSCERRAQFLQSALVSAAHGYHPALTLPLAGVAVLFSFAVPRQALGGGVLFVLLMAILFSVPLVAALFIIRGYELEATELLIRRLLWSTRLSLLKLREAWADPTAMKRSLRLFGNDGLFSITGLFWNRRLGRYRAFATAPSNAVVLKLADRIVVVTPERPDDFLAILKLYRPHVRIGEAPPPS
jgi:Bacterial PH domain